MMSGLTKLNITSLAHQTKYLNLIFSRTFYEKYRHGPTKISNPTPPYAEWVIAPFTSKGRKILKEEALKVIQAKKNKRHMLTFREPDKTYIFEHFDTDDSMNRWKPAADSDSLHGFSVSRFIRSPQGHGLFTGMLDNRLPDDGLTMRSGFTAVIGPKKQRDKFFAMQAPFYDWRGFNAIEIRFRGDGRKYSIVVNTSDDMSDLSWYDNFSYPLYTTGGPYWQKVSIPLSKFFFSSKCFIQDEQGLMPLHSIKFVAVTLEDRVDGPFSLEIDYIGLRNETVSFHEKTCYEHYAHSHIQYKPLQVGCYPPETE